MAFLGLKRLRRRIAAGEVESDSGLTDSEDENEELKTEQKNHVCFVLQFDVYFKNWMFSSSLFCMLYTLVFVYSQHCA